MKNIDPLNFDIEAMTLDDIEKNATTGLEHWIGPWGLEAPNKESRVQMILALRTMLRLAGEVRALRAELASNVIQEIQKL